MITREKDLRTGRAVWTAYRIPRVPHQPMTKNENADIVVIGAGISGAMIAQELTEAGFSVMIVDRRGPMKGSTSATTALLQYEIDTPLIKLCEQIGETKAIRAWRRSKLGLGSLAAKIQLLKIDCDFDRYDALYLSGNTLDAQHLKQEAVLRNLAGLPTAYLTRTDLQKNYHIARQAALLSTDNLSVNPLQLTAGFLNTAIKQGAKIFSPVEITDLKQRKKQITLMTDQGLQIKAKKVIFTTGYETPKIIHTKRHTIHSTWALATKAQPDKIHWGKHFIWEASEPYLYIRTTPDGRIICGGEDEDFSDEETRDALLPKKIEVLQRKLHKLFPAIDPTPEFAWAGSFGASTTGLPSIGKVPHLANCYAAMAYGGNGITFSRIAAEIIRADLTGQQDPDADLFAFPK